MQHQQNAPTKQERLWNHANIFKTSNKTNRFGWSSGLFIYNYAHSSGCAVESVQLMLPPIGRWSFAWSKPLRMLCTIHIHPAITSFGAGHPLCIVAVIVNGAHHNRAGVCCTRAFDEKCVCDGFCCGLLFHKSVSNGLWWLVKWLR